MGLSGNKSATNLCLPTAPQFNFHLWCRFFSGFAQINNLWQQKQLLLFLRNMTPNCCRLKWCCRGTSQTEMTASNAKIVPFFGILDSKRRQNMFSDGRNFCQINDWRPLIQKTISHFSNLQFLH